MVNEEEKKKDKANPGKKPDYDSYSEQAIRIMRNMNFDLESGLLGKNGKGLKIPLEVQKRGPRVGLGYNLDYAEEKKGYAKDLYARFKPEEGRSSSAPPKIIPAPKIISAPKMRQPSFPNFVIKPKKFSLVPYDDSEEEKKERFKEKEKKKKVTTFHLQNQNKKPHLAHLIIKPKSIPSPQEVVSEEEKKSTPLVPYGFESDDDESEEEKKPTAEVFTAHESGEVSEEESASVSTRKLKTGTFDGKDRTGSNPWSGS
ncbi:unnamed protein product [Arabidopsis halleri]